MVMQKSKVIFFSYILPKISVEFSLYQDRTKLSTTSFISQVNTTIIVQLSRIFFTSTQLKNNIHLVFIKYK